MGTYQLELTLGAPAPGAPASLDDALAYARAKLPALAALPGLVCTAHGARVDGAGFTYEVCGARRARLVSSSDRGPRDERAMELLASALVGPAGSAFERHTGRAWEGPVLAAWLAHEALLSGRALAMNEARVTRRAADAQAALAELERRAEALCDALVQSEEPASPLRARVVRELSLLGARPALAWSCAGPLARLGELAMLEALAQGEALPRAFSLAARAGAGALPFFERALAHDDPAHRRAAAASLHLLGDPAALPLVERALRDKRSSVREAVFEQGFDALWALDDAGSVLGPHLERLTRDPSSAVRRALERLRTGS